MLAGGKRRIMNPVIGLDIRKLNDFGIGSYIRHILEGIASSGSSEFHFRLFHSAESFPQLPSSLSNVSSLISWNLHRKSPFQSYLSQPPRIDVFHAPHYVAPDPGLTPMILTVHDLIHLEPPLIPRAFFPLGTVKSLSFDLVKRAYHRFLAGIKFSEMVKSAYKLIAVSQSTASKLKKRFPFLTSDQIQVIHNCVDDVFFQPESPDKVEKFVTSMKFPYKEYLLFCGNDFYHKNIAGLLEALKIIRDKRNITPCLVMSGPPRKELIMARAKQLGVQNSVFFIDRYDTESVAMIYQGALGLVSPSLEEGFGLPLAEAMASGTPIACSDIPVYREITGGNAQFFNPYDPALMASKLEEFLVNSRLRKDLSELGSIQAEKFRLKAFWEAHLRIYRGYGIGL
jgi:glycosyltransferase involved in cell wall biosynthesis